MLIATSFQVDFVLLAGDLFHDNRPTRDTLYQVMSLLREYTLNDRPVQIELMSDPNEGQAAGCSCVAMYHAVHATQLTMVADSPL